ncbi:CAP domain-containing protein [Leucobacter soli]|uniref:CAP domain-containing protein n=1 Tax=Leucobacter soli TaxID=2812850 RepID=UPI0036207741
MRTQILDRTNALRKAAGVPALKMNTDINTVAQTWSCAQASKKKMSHNPSYSKQIPSGWRTAGENVAYGYASAKAVVTAWKNSDGHYANMVRSTFTHVGIGIALDSKGRLYYTQTFGVLRRQVRRFRRQFVAHGPRSDAQRFGQGREDAHREARK